MRPWFARRLYDAGLCTLRARTCRWETSRATDAPCAVIDWVGWLQVPACAVAHSGAAAVQARADVHPGRGGRRAGLVPHPEHRPHAEDVLLQVPVHRRVAEGGHVQQRQRHLPHEVRRRRVHRHSDRAPGISRGHGRRRCRWYVLPNAADAHSLRWCQLGPSRCCDGWWWKGGDGGVVG